MSGRRSIFAAWLFLLAASVVAAERRLPRQTAWGDPGDVSHMAEGQAVGLCPFGKGDGGIGVTQTNNVRHVTYSSSGKETADQAPNPAAGAGNSSH